MYINIMFKLAIYGSLLNNIYQLPNIIFDRYLKMSQLSNLFHFYSLPIYFSIDFVIEI